MYEAKNYEHLLGLTGFSDLALKTHFTLYQGYVTNTNKLADALTLMVTEGKASAPEYNELKRRFGWEFNGMRLHELYFDNLNLLLMQEIKSLQPNGLVELIFFDNSFLPMKQGENTFQVRINVASLEDEIDYVNNFSIWKFFVSADGRPTGSVQAISN